MKKIVISLILTLSVTTLYGNGNTLLECIDDVRAMTRDSESTSDQDDDYQKKDYTQIWTEFDTTLAGEHLTFSFPTLKRKINYVLQHGYSVGTSISDDDGAKYNLTYILQAYIFDKWASTSNIFEKFLSNINLSKNNQIISSEITSNGTNHILDAVVYDKHEKYYSRYHYLLTPKCGYLFVVHYSDGYIEQMDQVIQTIQIQ